MPLFTEIFALNKSQAEIDFVNVDVAGDAKLYLCPYAIQIRKDDWSENCGDHIRSFFNELLEQLRLGNEARVKHILGNLHEPNETRLGESKGRPRGRGIGREKADLLGRAFRNSRAFQTGVLSDVSEIELFIHGIGPDTISDLTTNILRGLLASYTAEQCKLHDVPTSVVRSLGPVWNIETRNWESRELQLPTYAGKPILLVPKFSVRHQISLTSQEFYNFHMVEFLQTEYLNAGAALVETLKNGTRRVTKTSVKEVHPLIKDDLAAFVRDHPEVLEAYKKLKGASGPPELDDLELGFDESAFATALIERLADIPMGADNASSYHSLAMGICTFLFFPHLITPVKEYEQHEGRKRVDIKYTNAANGGFFHHVLSAPQTRAMSVYVECKNYNRRVANPELDQLAGRFNIRQGKFGLLLCRHMENRQRVIAGCRDTCLDDRGVMLPIEDSDLVAMLQLIQNDRRSRIDQYLHKIFDEVAA